MARKWGTIQKIMRWLPRSKANALTEEQLRIVFKEHDTNGDGHLDKEELKEAFRTLGARIPGYRADRAIHYSDIDLDGTINEDEIEHLVSYAKQYGYTLN